jgi:hypothetical protein
VAITTAATHTATSRPVGTFPPGTRSAKRDYVGGDEGRGVQGQVDDHFGDLGRAGNVEQGGARGDGVTAASLTQPVSVTGGCTMLAVMPNLASSRAADIVYLTWAAFAAPYETSSGKPRPPPEVRPMIRPQVAPRAMCRRANSAIISAVAIASTLNCCRQVSAVTR